MHQILYKIMKQWPIQTTVLAMTLCVMSVGFAVRYAPSAYSYYHYSVPGLSFIQNTRRVALIKQSIREPNMLSSITARDIELILQTPSLVRTENNIQAWHYHGDSCAIDIYFKGDADKPDYIEFRTLTLNQDVSHQFKDTDDAFKNQYCIKAVLAAQGVETPNSYAARPTPSTVSPYSS